MRDTRTWLRGVGMLAVCALIALPLAAEPESETVDSVEETRQKLQRSLGDDVGGGEPEARRQAGATGGSSLSRALDRLTIHGYLTQAYADATFVDGGPTSDEIALGIPEDGTTAYRTMAIQFRYEISDRDIMLVQLSHRALGESPIEDAEDEVELDWAFYERRLTDHTSLKLGRVQIPLGIFNEIRDVGTLLPFYRPAYVFYYDGIFTSETVDGFVLSHTFFPLSEWSLEADVYYGEYDLVELSVLAPDSPEVATNEDAVGFQLWLNTPVDGLRFGIGADQSTSVGGQEGINRPVGGEAEVESFHASIEYATERFVFRSELRDQTLEETAVLFEVPRQDLYVQVGYHFSEKFRLYAQYEERTSDFDIDSIERFLGAPILNASGSFDILARKDVGVALNYLFAPNLVFKAEYHFDIEAGNLGFAPVFLPGPPFFGFNISETSQDGGSYWIVSFSASF